MKNITKLALISSVTSIIFVGCGGASSEVRTAKTSTTNRRDNSSVAFSSALETTHRDILIAVNKARAEARDCHDGKGIVGPVEPLVWNSELYASAYEHSSDLATSDTFSHDGSGTSSDITGSNNNKKSSFNERILATGYTDFKLIGENIAGGLESIDVVVEAWLLSPKHCTNMMEREFTEMGVAIVVDEKTKYGIYWTQNLGGR